MTTAQKVIKYLAISFAVFLIVTIISSILSVLYGLSIVLGLKKDNNKIISEDMSITEFENNDIATLEVDVIGTNLMIKKGDFLRAETNNSNISCKQNNQNLQIKEKNHNWFSNNENSSLTVYIPENLEFEKIKINAGAGKINIENLTAKNLSFELGAGETEIQKLNVSKKCNIDGGAGKVNILSGTINNLDLNMGVGEVNLKAKITGKSDIDAGVGSLNMKLQDNKETYKIKTDKGIGSVKIDGKEISDNEIYGDGENYVEIDGGIGNITVNFKGE